MLLENMSWMDVERSLAADDRIVVITGACEQHGYVSLLADTLRVAPLAIARAAAEREPVLIAPQAHDALPLDIHDAPCYIGVMTHCVITPTSVYPFVSVRR